jgi:FkbH-like protein
MRALVANILDKIGRHGSESLLEVAGRAVRFAEQSARANISLAGCELGVGVRCVGRVVAKPRGRIVLGNDVRLNAPWNPIVLRAEPGAEIKIGDDCDINYGTLIAARTRVTIGNRVMMGNHCIVADFDEPSSGTGVSEPIEIGDGAWLAVRVTVLPGAKIGAGAVITAGSVVSGEIPPNVVAAGIPARVVRSVAGPQVATNGNGATHHANGEHNTNGKTNGEHANGKANGEHANGKTNGTVAPAAAAAAPTSAKTVVHRGTLIADFTIDELVRDLERRPGPVGLEAVAAPFGQVVQSLLQAPDPAATDFAVVWTRPESIVPAFQRVAGFESVGTEALLADVDQFCDLVAKAAQTYRAVFVPTWTIPAYERGLGLIDARESGIAHALATMNLRLMDRLGKIGNAYVLDAQRWLSRAGKNATTPKLWYLGKVPFHADVFAEAARDIHAAMVGLGGGARKLLIVDLDDTMWGGIVGDVGWENLRLGGHDGIGEAFVDFQRAVKNLTRRGIVLGIVSKNEEATALEAIRSHPEMVLREDDFVGHRINWRDKAQNIVELTRELNLGLQSVVFIDDNPVERARVREALPEVLVPDWPDDKHLYRSALAALRCFDAPSISKEDAERTSLYAAERKREQLQASVGSMDEWLKSLGIVVTVEPLGPSNLPRTAQLLNKTNQLNLTTRRLTEAELTEWVADPSRALWAVTVRDRFGDAGLTGIVSLEMSGTTARIVDYVLSCRVMGRKVEETMVHLAVEHARSRGAERIEAIFVPTSKNKPCLTFWQSSGFGCDDGQTFVWDARNPYSLPGPVQLEWRR